MSGLVLNERLIDKQSIKSKTITIKRCANTNMGVRVWFEILTTELEFFQHWSLLMNHTDEVLFLAKPGDILTIDYIEDIAEDIANGTFESFRRNVILRVKSFMLAD